MTKENTRLIEYYYFYNYLVNLKHFIEKERKIQTVFYNIFKVKFLI